jgi:hypothetical protein
VVSARRGATSWPACYGGFTAGDAHGLAMVFLQQSAMVAVATLALLALVPWLKRLMGGVR